MHFMMAQTDGPTDAPYKVVQHGNQEGGYVSWLCTV